jgi:Ala-tRNA(Pro) deacylase
MPIEKMKEFLESSGTDFEVIKAPSAYTAQETAAQAHVPGKELAKTVIVKANGTFAMAVLPATDRVDFGLLKGLAEAGSVELASEEEFTGLFPDCEVGAMPPFGNLYDMKVFVETGLAEDEKICFYGCDHSRLIRMAYADYERLVNPKVGKFSQVYAAAP